MRPGAARAAPTGVDLSRPLPGLGARQSLRGFSDKRRLVRGDVMMVAEDDVVRTDPSTRRPSPAKRFMEGVISCRRSHVELLDLTALAGAQAGVLWLLQPSHSSADLDEACGPLLRSEGSLAALFRISRNPIHRVRSAFGRGQAR